MNNLNYYNNKKYNGLIKKLLFIILKTLKFIVFSQKNPLPK